MPEQHAPLIVDLGCGPGNTALFLSKSFPNARIIGLDIDKEMVSYAQAHHTLQTDINGNQISTRCKFYVQNASADWNDGWSKELKQILVGKVDAVFSNYALNWMIGFKGLANNLSKMLRSNGRLVGNLLYDGDILTKCDSDKERAFIQEVLPYPSQQQLVSDFLFAFHQANFNRFEIDYFEDLSIFPEEFFKNSKNIF